MVASLDRVPGAQLDWRTRVGGGRGLSTVQEWVLELYRSSRRVTSVEVSTIPGLAQIEGYARRVLAEMAANHQLDWDDDDLALAVSARLRRQELLYDPSRSFGLLITEPVLGWAYCDPHIMAAQIDRLVTLSTMANVRLGVIPQTSPAPTIVQHSFSVFDDLVIVETGAAEYHHHGDTPAAAYLDLLDRYWAAAVEGTAARDLLLTYAETYRHRA
jgi:hypothetical protein